MIKSYLPMPLPPKKRGEKKNSAFKRWVCFFGALSVAGFFCWGINHGQVGLENYLFAQISAPIKEMAVVSLPPRPTMSLDAAAALCLRVGTAKNEKIIFEKNTDEVLPIASLTKLMTAMVVLENSEIYNPAKFVVISQAAAEQPDVPISGNLFFGEVRTVKELLHLTLFYSSNDAAYALAELMSENDFVAAMNRAADKIGLLKTVFFNPTGLDLDDGRANYSTARDLLAFSKYILEFYPEIFAMTKTPGLYRTQNGIFDFHLWDGQKLVGGKTGYTQKAGGCMIAVFESDAGWRHVGILLGSLNSETRVAEMQKMVNFANNYNLR